jgi:hypothetical protein
VALRQPVLDKVRAQTTGPPCDKNAQVAVRYFLSSCFKCVYSPCTPYLMK